MSIGFHRHFNEAIDWFPLDVVAGGKLEIEPVVFFFSWGRVSTDNSLDSVLVGGFFRRCRSWVHQLVGNNDI
jgi:hypothetical protein